MSETKILSIHSCVFFIVETTIREKKRKGRKETETDKLTWKFIVHSSLFFIQQGKDP